MYQLDLTWGLLVIVYNVSRISGVMKVVKLEVGNLASSCFISTRPPSSAINPLASISGRFLQWFKQMYSQILSISFILHKKSYILCMRFRDCPTLDILNDSIRFLSLRNMENIYTYTYHYQCSNASTQSRFFPWNRSRQMTQR